MSYNSKYTGVQVDALLDIVAQGGSGGGEGGEVQKTTEAEILAMGFTKNEGTITGVKMNGASKGTSGVVDLGNVVTDVSGKQDKITDLDTIRSGASAGATAVQPGALAAVATSGSYNDLSNKPTIPAEQVNADWNATSGKAQILNKPTIPTAVTESTVSGWGFTKNTGTITGVAINGTAINANEGTVYIPNASTGSYGATKLNSSTNSTSTAEAATPSAVKAAYDLANGKQDKLTSGTNIKTINGQSLLGSGNITIEGGSGGSGGNYVEKEVLGETVVANIQGFNTGNMVYGLPDTVVHGDADDYLVSAGTLKTINGQSLIGEGDIEISGGGVYITPFTVDEFFRTFIELTDEQRNELFNAASQNRIIGIRFSHYDSSGYIIASYRNSVYEELSSVDLSFVWEGAHYNRRFYSNEELNSITRLVTTSFLPVFYSVAMENGVALVFDDLSLTDNSVFLVNGECSELHVYLEPSEIGKTVRFFTGESCTLEVDYSVYWANGEVPTIEPYTHYELSLVVNAEGVFNAVLTPFKLVE